MDDEIASVLGDVPREPPADSEISSVGSVPRGFFEEATPGRCDDASPAFMRGLLLPRKDYDAFSLEKKTKLHLPPRWTLYGGPIQSVSVARDWVTYMQFWAQSQGLIWVPYPNDTPCVVQAHRIPWPAQSAFGWTWVREVEHPRRVILDKSTGKYVWEAPYASV